MAQENNENIEMITGDPKKAIVRLALPVMLSMLLIMFYNIADSIWVAGLGADALAALGFISPLFMVLAGLGSGIGAGANSLIARFIGAQNHPQANNSALHAVLLSVIISAIFTVIIEVFMVPILKFMGAGNTIQYAMDYSYIVFGFLFVFVYSSVASAIFRSEGDVRRATIAIAVTAVMNIVLDPILIYVLDLGMQGAAWATVISASLSCLIMSYWIWGKKDLYLDLSPKNFNFQMGLVFEILEVSIPSTLETVVFSALVLIVNTMIVLAAGTTAVAAYTASIRIVQLSTIPLIGFGTAVLTVSGVAYGACNYINLKTSHSYSILLGFATSAVLAALMILLSGQIAAVFSYTEASAAIAPQISYSISVISLFVLVMPHGIMSSMLFQGVGKGFNSLVITLLRSLILESVFAYIFCFIFGWGLTGIYAGLIVGCFIGGTVGFIWARIFISRFKGCAKKDTVQDYN